jgi:hypothetical protein
MNKTQIVILLIGMVFAGLSLFLIMSPFNLTYAYEHGGTTNTSSTWTFLQVTCPAPIDSCDKGTTQIGQAICADCNSVSSSKWIWFGVWEAMIIMGTGIGVYASKTGATES